jgi:hypothetical protein
MTLIFFISNFFILAFAKIILALFILIKLFFYARFLLDFDLLIINEIKTFEKGDYLVDLR